MSEDELVEEFFSEVNDKYYPQVLEGTNLLDEMQIEEGIEILSRPLHTIKGVTGFMSGFEPASSFTHKVESFLKKIQSGEIEQGIAQIAVAIESINAIFTLIEQLKNTGSYDNSLTDAIEAKLLSQEQSQSVTSEESKTAIEVEIIKDKAIISLGEKRIYTEPFMRKFIDEFMEIPANTKVLIDFSSVTSTGSWFYETLASFTESHDIHLTNLNDSCLATLYVWRLGNMFKIVDNKQDFLGSN